MSGPLKRALVALVLATVPALAPPAAASGTALFHGSAYLPNVGGIGGCDGTFTGTVTGVVGSTAVVEAEMFASYCYVEPWETCPLVSYAWGRVWVPAAGYQVDFTWTRVGVAVHISGSDGGVGTAEIAGTARVPCPMPGQPVQAAVAGTYTTP